MVVSTCAGKHPVRMPEPPFPPALFLPLATHNLKHRVRDDMRGVVERSRAASAAAALEVNACMSQKVATIRAAHGALERQLATVEAERQAAQAHAAAIKEALQAKRYDAAGHVSFIRARLDRKSVV